MILPDKTRLQYLSWLTLLGMSAIGVLLISYLQQSELEPVLLGGKQYYLQALAGLFFGSLSALLAVALLNDKRFKGVRSFFEEMMHGINPSLMNILFYSACASVGEEILFRAGLQPLIGIWPAAILFVFLHGYFHPTNISLSIYGAFLVIICAGFGYLFKFFGLAGAVVAHFVYDVSMFSVLKYSYRARVNAAAKRQT